MDQTIQNFSGFQDSIYEGAKQRSKDFIMSSRRGTFQNLNLKNDQDQDMQSIILEQNASNFENTVQHKQYASQAIEQNSLNQVCVTFNDNKNKKKETILKLANSLQIENRQLKNGQKEEKKNYLNNRWKKSAFMIMIKVRQFLNNVKNLGISVKFKELNNKIFSVINDQASDYEFYKFNRLFDHDQPGFIAKQIYQIQAYVHKSIVKKINLNKLLMKTYNAYQNKKFIIDPNSLFMIIWNTLLFIILLVNLFYIPIKIAFINIQEEGEHNFNLQYYQRFLLQDLPGAVLIIQIFLNFYTAYFEQGELILEKTLIVRNYFRGNFTFDSILSIIFLININSNASMLDMILLLRYYKLKKIAGQFEDIMNLRGIKLAVYNLFKLILLIIFLAHYCGLCFFYVSESEKAHGYPGGVGWVTRQQLDIETWENVYVNTLYWAVITMISIGYGDIVPTTSLEKIVVINVALLGCGMFAYAVNNIGTIFQDISKRNAKFKEKLSLLSTYMKKRGLSIKLQTRVRKYYEYIQQEHIEDHEEVEGMIQQMTGLLKKEVLTDIYMSVLKEIKLFRLNFSKEFLLELAPWMKEKRVMPDELLFVEGEKQEKICYILKGNAQVEITLGSSQKCIKKLSRGDYFGQRSFISDTISQYSVKSLNVVTYVFITFSDFMEVIRRFPLDKERFFELKDNIKFSKNSKGTGIKCIICDNYQHTFKECPMSVFHPYRQRLFNSFNYSIQQVRQDYNRIRQRTQNSRIYIDLLKEQLIQYMYDNEMQDQLEKFLEQEREQDEEYKRQYLVLEEVQLLSGNGNVRDAYKPRKQQKSNSILYGSSSMRRQSLQINCQKQYGSYNQLFELMSPSISHQDEMKGNQELFQIKECAANNQSQKYLEECSPVLSQKQSLKMFDQPAMKGPDRPSLDIIQQAVPSNFDISDGGGCGGYSSSRQSALVSPSSDDYINKRRENFPSERALGSYDGCSSGQREEKELKIVIDSTTRNRDLLEEELLPQQCSLECSRQVQPYVGKDQTPLSLKSNRKTGLDQLSLGKHKKKTNATIQGTQLSIGTDQIKNSSLSANTNKSFSLNDKQISQISMSEHNNNTQVSLQNRINCPAAQMFLYIEKLVSLDIDRIKDYLSYYPEGNFSSILSRYQMISQKVMSGSSRRQSIDKLLQLYESAMEKQKKRKKKNNNNKSIFDIQSQHKLSMTQSMMLRPIKE